MSDALATLDRTQSSNGALIASGPFSCRSRASQMLSGDNQSSLSLS